MGFACPAQKIWVEPPGGSCGSLKNMLYYSLLMRHRQAVRQGTLTPPSQVRLLLAQLCKKTCTEAELQPPVQVFLCAETGTGDGIGTVPPRKAFGRRGVLLHLSGRKPLSLPSACGCHEIDHLKCLACPVYHAGFILYIKTISLRRKKAARLLYRAAMEKKSQKR